MSNLGDAKTDVSQCCICTEMLTRTFPLQYRGYSNTRSRICVETPRFVAWPSLSPLAAGHMLVFPKVHVPNLLRLRQDEFTELTGLLKTLARHIESRFGRLLLFERGITQSEGTACGIDHAHFHLLPLSAGLIDKVLSQVKRDFEVQSNNSLSGLRFHHSGELPYLIIGESLESLQFIVSSEVPSQYVRQIVSRAGSLERWDWKALTNQEGFQRSLEAFGLT